jgi:hypothetical protein
VQVDRAVLGEQGGQAESEPGREQALAAPLDDGAELRDRIGCAALRPHMRISDGRGLRLTFDALTCQGRTDELVAARLGPACVPSKTE